ncbi:MAG: hypothetical protein ABW128_16915 [Rhizorhabdus sp.]
MKLTNEETALIRITENRFKLIQQLYDQLWTKSKDSGWFKDNKPLMDYMMWIDHEVSRNTANGQRDVQDLAKKLREHKEEPSCVSS